MSPCTVINPILLTYSTRHHHLTSLLQYILDTTPTIPQLHTPHSNNANSNPTPSPSESFSFEGASSSFSISPIPHSSPSITSRDTSTSLPLSSPSISETHNETVNTHFTKITTPDPTATDPTDIPTEESNHSLNEGSDPFNPFDIPRHSPFFTPYSTLNTPLLNEPSPSNATTSTEHTLSSSHSNQTQSSSNSFNAHTSYFSILHNAPNNSPPTHLTHNSNIISLQTLLADKNVISITSLAAKTFPDTLKDTPISNNLHLSPPSQHPLSHIFNFDDNLSYSLQSPHLSHNSLLSQPSISSLSLPPGQPCLHTSTPQSKSPLSLDDINSLLANSPMYLYSLEKQTKTQHPNILSPPTITSQSYSIYTPPDSPTHIQYLSELHKKNVI